MDDNQVDQLLELEEECRKLRQKVLQESKREHLERSRELGKQYAQAYLESCDDFGELQAISLGYNVTVFPDYMDFELTDPKFVEEFWGVPDFDAFLEGLNQGLKTQTMLQRARALVSSIK